MFENWNDEIEIALETKGNLIGYLELKNEYLKWGMQCLFHNGLDIVEERDDKLKDESGESRKGLDGVKMGWDQTQKNIFIK